MREHLKRSIIAAVILLCFSLVPAEAQAPPIRSIADILAAHQAWPVPPHAIRITGTVTRHRDPDGGLGEGPVAITATGFEEVATVTASKRLVATRERHFLDDGETEAPLATPAGFSQLDVTGVYFLAQLAQRPVLASLPESASRESRAVRLTVDGRRAERHYGTVRVEDRVEIFTGEDGLLAGLHRSFYDDEFFHFTQTYRFADYRETEGVRLPYRIEKYLKGHLVQTMTVDRYEFGVAVTPADFERRGRR